MAAFALSLVAAGEPDRRVPLAPGMATVDEIPERAFRGFRGFPFPNHPRFNRARGVNHALDFDRLTRGGPIVSETPRSENQGFARGDAFLIDRSGCASPQLRRADLEGHAEAILAGLPRCPEPAPHVRRISCVPAGGGAALLADGSEIEIPNATTWLVEVEGTHVPPTLPFPGLFHSPAESFPGGWYLIDDATGAQGDYGFSGSPSLYDERLTLGR